MIKLSFLWLEVSFLFTGGFIIGILFNSSLQIYISPDQSSSVRDLISVNLIAGDLHPLHSLRAHYGCMQ